MSKDELATTNQETGLTAADFGGKGLQVAGQEDQGLQLGKLVLYQGTAEEEEVYGKHDRGVWLDALENRELGTDVKIMPVFAWTTWARFVDGSNRPVYSTANKNEVPPEDLEWTGAEGNTPPAATESVNVVVAVEGEVWPYLLIFKRTSMQAFNKTIKPIEARRGATGKTPGLYLLTSADDKNAAGKPYKRVVARALGDPTPEIASLAQTVYSSMDQQTAINKAAEVEGQAGEAEPSF